MQIEIREMREADWPAIARIYKQGMDTNLATFQTDVPDYADWDNGHLTACRFVAVYDNAVVGWVALSPVSSRCVYAGVAEVSVYVSPERKGQGIGALLLSKLSTTSEKHGIWTLQAGIMQNNEASIRLHEKCGYRMVGYREKIGRDASGQWRTTVLMERRSALDNLDKERLCDGE